MTRTAQQQLTHFLSDMYSVEQQALAQLVSAPDVAGDPTIAEDFRQHHLQTEEQADLVRKRLEANGGSPSALKDAVMKLGGKSFLLFARAQPETPGRLVDHAYSYEAMEWAGYEMLVRFATHAGDEETVETATSIRSQERAMMERLYHGFDAAERVSHEGLPQQELDEHVCKHIAEAHAFEQQSIQLLKRSEQLAGDPAIEAIYSQALDGTGEHSSLLEKRLTALGSDTSNWKDAALASAGLNWSLFFQAQSDTPAKLAAFVYAFLHLQIGAYELLQRTAARAGDEETKSLCEMITRQKRIIAERLTDAFDLAVLATLNTVAE